MANGIQQLGQPPEEQLGLVGQPAQPQPPQPAQPPQPPGQGGLGAFTPQPQQRGFAQKLGEGLQAFGAGVQGRGPEFQAQLNARRRDQAKLSRERREALAKDALATRDFLAKGDVGSAIGILDNRLDFLNQLNADPSDTLKIKQKIAQGDRSALIELDAVVKFARTQGLLPEIEKEKDPTIVREMRAFGIDPKSKEGKDLFLKIKTKPGVKVSLGEAGFKVEPGFMLKDQSDPTLGVTPIPGGSKDTLAGENASKVQMLDTARKAFPGVEKLVFDKKGEIDRTNLFTAKLGIPGTEGRKLRTRMEFGIQAITRLETGAAMPPSEVENTRSRFFPSALDSKEAARLKLDMYKDFIDGTLKLLDPSGRFDEGRFKTEFDRRSGAEQEAPAQTFTFNPATGRIE